jgi:hypothetical protein
MKHLQIGLFLLTAFLLTSCSGGSQIDQIAGKWTLASFTNGAETVELTECDQQTSWDFTTEPAEALGDGTPVQKLSAKSPDNCEFYSFESKWTVDKGKLFISTLRIGGIGGNSLAGLLEIEELSDSKMVVSMRKRKLTFTR